MGDLRSFHHQNRSADGRLPRYTLAVPCPGTAVIRDNVIGVRPYRWSGHQAAAGLGPVPG